MNAAAACLRTDAHVARVLAEIAEDSAEAGDAPMDDRGGPTRHWRDAVST